MMAESIEPLTRRKQVMLQQLETLASQGPSTFGVSIINVFIVYVILRDVASPATLWSWTSVVVAFNCLRLIMVAVFWRMRSDQSYRFWTFLYLILVYCTGLAWGALALFPAFQQPFIFGFIVFVIAGTSAGGILSLYVKLSAAIPYFVAVIGPLIYKLAGSNEPHHIAMAILSGLFLILLIRTTYSLNAVARKTIQLEIENRDLMDFLVQAREIQDQTLTAFNK